MDSIHPSLVTFLQDKMITSRGLLVFGLLSAFLHATAHAQIDDVRRSVMLQVFGWNSEHQGLGNWYDRIASRAPEIRDAGFSTVWFPPPCKDRTGPAGNGYFAADFYDLGNHDQFGGLETRFGSLDELKAAVKSCHAVGLEVLGDIVVNHRAATEQDAQGRWSIFHGASGKMWWEGWANPNHSDCKDSGDAFGQDDICHTQEKVMEDLVEWMKWLQQEVGYDGWRFDYSKGYGAKYAQQLIEATGSPFTVGEFWTSMAYQQGDLATDQNGHRQQLANWVDGTQGIAWAFDFTTKGVLQQAVNGQYWRMKDAQGKNPGFMGWWPGRSVTFIENHDTGSLQQHWPFPADHLLEGYAYILTHPGIPCVFWEHYEDATLREKILALVQVRQASGIHAESPLHILEAKADLYAARIGTGASSLVMKLGTASWQPGEGHDLLTSGPNYAVWAPRR